MSSWSRGCWPLATSHSLTEPDEHLVEAITLGRREMPPWGDVLSEEEIEALVAFIRKVQRGGA